MGSRIIIITLLSLSVVLVSCQDISILLQNVEFVDKQLRCIMQTGPCDQMGRSLKALLPEIIANNCGRCNMGQKMNANRLIHFIKDRFPSEWLTIVSLYGLPLQQGRDHASHHDGY